MRPLNYLQASRSYPNNYKGMGDLTDSSSLTLQFPYSIEDWLSTVQPDNESQLTLQFPYGVALQDSIINNKDVQANQIPGQTTLGFPYAVGGTGIQTTGAGMRFKVNTKTLLWVAGGLGVLLLISKKR